MTLENMILEKMALDNVAWNNTRIAFIGAGNMANSLVGGLLAKGLPAAQISASDPYAPSREALARSYGVAVTDNNAEIIGDADVVILAVKPQVMKAVAQEMASVVQRQRPLVISIAAGIGINSLQNWLGPQTAIVRCMPNTPALVQQGATGLFANACVSAEQKVLAKTILDAVGLSLWLDKEQQLDAVTALSGSGPAYYFLLMEAMIATGIRQGLDADTARQLTLQTALGAATMAASSADSPAELRRKVTSPKGTTEQAILAFQSRNFEKIVDEALDAARQRSVELSKAYE